MYVSALSASNCVGDLRQRTVRRKLQAVPYLNLGLKQSKEALDEERNRAGLNNQLEELEDAGGEGLALQRGLEHLHDGQCAREALHIGKDLGRYFRAEALHKATRAHDRAAREHEGLKLRELSFPHEQLSARADLLLRRDFRAPKSAERHAVKVHQLVEVGPLASRLLKLPNAVHICTLLESAEERLDVIMNLLALLLMR